MLVVCTLLLTAVLVACGNKDKEEMPKENALPEIDENIVDEAEEEDITTVGEIKTKSEKSADIGKVDVDIKDQAGKNIGTAELTEGDKGVIIQLHAEGLTPGKHGFHFHEKALCEGPDFKSAGAHFNPFGKEHGLLNPKGPHAGDMPNIEIDENGIVDQKITTNYVTLKKGEKNSLLDDGGKSLMIHSDPDDEVSQPAGNSGDRIACGVVKGK